MGKKINLYIAWLIATLGTVGSLYFSEVEKLPVCTLCWYQRICLFPLPILLGMAVWRNKTDLIIYTAPQIVIGLLFALYQTLIGIFPELYRVHLCHPNTPCDGEGYFLPSLSLLCFILILWFSLAAKRKNPT